MPARRMVALMRLRLDRMDLSPSQYVAGLAIIESAARNPTVPEIAQALGLQPSTWLSWTFRARVASPARLVSLTRLVLANALLQTATGADVAAELDCSSEQTLTRWLRQQFGSSIRRERTVPLEDRLQTWQTATQASLRVVR